MIAVTGSWGFRLTHTLVGHNSLLFEWFVFAYEWNPPCVSSLLDVNALDTEDEAPKDS